MTENEWILVANASRARLLHRAGSEPARVVANFEHPASRLHAHVLSDDLSGRAQSDQGDGARAMTPRMDAQHKEHLRFAHELARHLDEGARQNGYDALVLFSSPPFLGLLREALGEASRRRLVAGVPVDLTHVGEAELERRIAEERASI